MCYFITVSIPNSDTEILKSGIPRGLHLIESSNPSINHHMPEKYVSYVVTSGGCSCDLFSEEPEEYEHDRRINKLRKKYKRKGWSESKIERSLSQAKSAAQTPKTVGLRDDVRYYLSDVFNQINEMRIVVHWYNGDVETEKISISKKLLVSSDKFRNENPVRQTDTLFVLK